MQRRRTLAQGQMMRGVPVFVFALLCLCLCARANPTPTVPQCPYPCGDNPAMLCPHSEPVPGGQGHYTHTQIDTGFGAEDGWDVRVWQVDADKHKEQKLDLPPFKVMILDDDDWVKFQKNDPNEEVQGCTDESVLNKDTTCFSLQTKECKPQYEGKKFLNYTHVVIVCKGDVHQMCMLSWDVRGIFMPEQRCWWFGLPCGYWTGLLWLLVFAGLAGAAFLYREMLLECASKIPVPEGMKEAFHDFFKGPWRIFSGRSFGVEEMEARLAQRGEGLGGDSIMSDGTREPYTRL